MKRIIPIILLILICSICNLIYAQHSSYIDTTQLKYSIQDNHFLTFPRKSSFYLLNQPINIIRNVDYDPKSGYYIIQDRLGTKLYRPPLYLTLQEYKKQQYKIIDRKLWNSSLASNFTKNENNRYNSIAVQTATFTKLFGGNTIEIIPRGNIDISLAGQYDKNENPFLNEKVRNQFKFDVEPNINMNLTGKIGNRALFQVNINSKAQFDFENQIRFDYKGKEEDIVKRIEIGLVNMPLKTSLIQGSESLFGIKSQLQIGALSFVGIVGQKKSTSREIILNRGIQKGEIDIDLHNYEANQHYFLAQYFRNNYNKSLSTPQYINSPINITKIEVWINNNGSVTTTGSRNILALLDLGESNPYNQLITKNTNIKYPSSGIHGQSSTEKANNLLEQLGESARLLNKNSVQTFFAFTGATDNYAQLTSAQKLVENIDFSINRKLGYISLQSPLNKDQILAVSYRYTINGKEYQVGEFSNDINESTTSPTILFTKLLKNDILKTSLPTWNLMMKNIYRLNASNISEDNFDLQIVRTDNSTNIASPILKEGQHTKNKTWLELTHLDRITQSNIQKPDGIFDWIPNVTIDSKAGRLIFPVIEPFGIDLSLQFAPTEQDLKDKYTYPELYELTQSDAKQLFTHKNRYKIQGRFSTGSTNEFHLGILNLRPESIRVTTGVLLLNEEIDYSIDYDVGILRIINQTLLLSGQPIKVTIEDDVFLGTQQKTLMGARFDYYVNENLSLGSTVMRLSETATNQKVTLGNEPILNTMYGVDINYSKTSPWLTRIVQRFPFLHTKEPSRIDFYGEIARLSPSSSSGTNNPRQNKGTSYIDDFENSFTHIEMKSQMGWQISATPDLFVESTLLNDLAYGYNRALLAVYTIDPIFYQPSAINPKVDNQYLIDHRTRRVTEKEVFPFKEVRRGTDAFLPTLDFAYYPMLRGPYNYSYSQLLPNGTFAKPSEKWGGVFKKIDDSDFEAQNIDFIEMWLMDPMLTNQNKAGGDLYFNLGNISEDILKDGRKSLENALSPIGDISVVDQTVWGNVAKQQSAVYTFENTNQSRQHQDVGLDGMNNAEENIFHASFLSRVQASLEPQAFEELKLDPSRDDYIYYRGKHFNQMVSILDRYKFINGTQGNTRTGDQSLEDFGVAFSARTLQPDGEDINHDNTMNETNDYFQYRFSTRPHDLMVGKNYIVEEQVTKGQILNKNIDIKWYKVRIPLQDYESKIGNIQNFKNIRFLRIFMTNFADTTVLRFAKLQFVKGSWRKYNSENISSKTIVDPTLGNTISDHSTFYISNINIEENGKRMPIPYVVPPGISRQIDYTTNNLNIQQNEQALSLQLFNLKDGYGRAAYKTAQHDLRPYGRLRMFVHAEGQYLTDGEVTSFIRLGTDDEYNYYEYEQPLTITKDGDTSPELIWPAQNEINIPLKYFLEAKASREKADLNGLPWPSTQPYTYTVNGHKITILGSPDLSTVRFYMIGIKNPLRGSILSPPMDNGSTISGEFWFNELRLTEYETKGGWAAIGRLNVQLADVANIALTASKSTIGFGTLTQRIGARNRNDHLFYDITTGIDFGKFFPPRSGINIPFYFNYSKEITTPEYNPLLPDIKLNTTLSTLNTNKRDSLLQRVRANTIRKSISFTNIRKVKTVNSKSTKPWHIENLGLTLAYSEVQYKDFNTQKKLYRDYKAILDYNYNAADINFQMPFKKVKSNNLAILRDFSFNLIPSLLHFRVDINRIYQENTFRDNSNDNILPTYYNKNFNINRIYGISWNLTPSIRLDFNATNYSIIDEPYGQINSQKQDTLWNNFWKLGRTTDYNHMMNITYNLPINKLPHLDWITISTRYGTNFNWQSSPLNLLKNENNNLGNSIQNNRTIQVNPTLYFNAFYNKFGFIRNNRRQNSTRINGFLIHLLTSIRQLNAAYTKSQGTYLPGYLPKTNLLGYDFKANAPGLGFIIGSQANILHKAIPNNWLTKDSMQNNLFVNTLTENLSGIINVQPTKKLKIDFIFSKVHNRNTTSLIQFNESIQTFQQGQTYQTGNYTISNIALHTSFRSNTKLYEKLNQHKQEISLGLADNNINSVGITKDYFADGYGKDQQDVLVNAFLNLYSPNKKISLDRKPIVPFPNWRLNYNGLATILAIEDQIHSINISHAYQSFYSISAYTSNSLHKEENTMVYSRDYNNNFTAKQQYSTITITDRFSPLLGIDIRLKNAVSINGEYRQSRDVNLNLQNSQFVIFEEKSILFGISFRKNNIKLPLGLYSNKKWNNDVNFKVELAVNDRKTSIISSRRLEAEIAGGNKSISLNPTLDYTINNRYTIRLFYNSNSIQPYTSQNYTTTSTYFGINFSIQFQ